MTAQQQSTQVGLRERIAGDDAWELAAAEYRRMLELIRTLRDGDWTRPTDCTAWDVRGMLGHLVGAAEGFASPVELVHQYRLGAKLRKTGEVDGHLPVDGANAVQVRERAGATPLRNSWRGMNARPRRRCAGDAAFAGSRVRSRTMVVASPCGNCSR